MIWCTGYLTLLDCIGLGQGGRIRIRTTRGSDRPVSVDRQVLGKSDRIGSGIAKPGSGQPYYLAYFTFSAH